MRGQRVVEHGSGHAAGGDLRQRLLAGAPVVEQRLLLAGVPTAVLEGGSGPPVVLLHGQGGWAGLWLPAIAELVRTHRVVAPDLPGVGAAPVAWLGEFVDRTCATPPVLVGPRWGARWPPGSRPATATASPGSC